MIELTLSGGKVVLSMNIVLFDELQKLYDIPKVGEKLLRCIYYKHSTSDENPFKDLDISVKEHSIYMSVFNQPGRSKLKLSKKNEGIFIEAEKLFEAYEVTPEKRLNNSINRKFDEISRLLDETPPEISTSETSSGETKYNSNLPIILNMFGRIETIMKAKDKLSESIKRHDSVSKLKGGNNSSFREKGLLK
ncbi:MAG: hypothetical protein KAH32_06360 [Chlamydiia bacterium]|nr:hypothetical protein [Chlamydiia bacterium]